MERHSGSSWIFVVLLAVLVGAWAPPSAGQEPKGNTPVGELPAAVREQARRAFASGHRCFIWKDANALVKVQSILGQTMISATGLSVLASPESDEIEFQQVVRLTARDKTTGAVSDLGVRNENMTFKQTASAKERRSFFFVFGGSNKEQGTVIALSGKGVIWVHLVAPGGGSSVAISNTLEIEVDMDSPSPPK